MGDEQEVEGQVENQSSIEGQAPPDGDRADGDKVEQPPKDGKWIPKHRFDEVNQGYTAYKEFGKPEDVRKALGRLKELEALPANRINDKEKGEIRKELLHVFPELQMMTSMLENQRQAYTERGSTINNEFLKEIGIEVNAANNQYLQELLSGIIVQDPKLMRRFYAMDTEVFKDAFAVAKKTFWPNVRKVVPGSIVQAKKLAPRTPTQQRPDEAKGEKKSDQMGRLEERAMLDDASEQAFALLESTRSE
jgi:hypothetical protein